MTNNLLDKTIAIPHCYSAIVKIPIFVDVFGLYFAYVYLWTHCMIIYILYDTSIYYINVDSIIII